MAGIYNPNTPLYMQYTRLRTLALLGVMFAFIFVGLEPTHARFRRLPVPPSHGDFPSYVHKKPLPEPSSTISLKHLGLLQLAAHDLFNVDRETEIDAENGKLDLSTLFDHGDEYIALGGEPRNRENIILFSVARKYGIRYDRLRDRGVREKTARKIIIRQYHRDLRKAYYYAFGETMPRARSGEATMTENLALRTVHDFLPGFVTIDGESVMTVDASLHGRHLTRKELQARSDELDGVFNDVFRDVVIFIPPDTILHIDLLERDSSFADQFGTDHSFEHFLSEVEDGSFDADDDVMRHIRSLFAKGMNI